MDVTNKEIISRLKFIGKLNKGDKINTIFMYVQSDNFFNKIARTLWNHDTRSNSKHFIENTIERIFEMLICYTKSEKESDKILCNNLIRDLKYAKNGILNLSETYTNDIKFKCDMDTIIESIDTKILEYTNYIKIYNTTDNKESNNNYNDQ